MQELYNANNGTTYMYTTSKYFFTDNVIDISKCRNNRDATIAKIKLYNDRFDLKETEEYKGYTLYYYHNGNGYKIQAMKDNVAFWNDNVIYIGYKAKYYAKEMVTYFIDLLD